MGESRSREERGPQDRWANRLLMGSAMLAVLAGANRLRTAWELPGDRYLLIHADDAGLCASVNRATIGAMERGAVTSASVMVPCPGFDEFAAFARERPDLDFGVHITLTSEWDGLRWGPVSETADVPTLVRNDGTFWQSAEDFARHADIKDIETEVRAQIKRARERGIGLSHLDNHMNSLFRRPEFIELFVQISIDENLPIRFSKQLPDGWEDVLPTDVVDTYYEQLKVLYMHRLPLADRIEADNYQVPPDRKCAYLLDLLRRLEPGVTELVVHCCDPSGDDWRPPDAAGRQAETEILFSREFASEIETLGVRLIDWRDFQRRNQDQDTVRPHW